MRSALVVTAVLGILATAAWAGADLVLTDGTVLQGRSVQRKEGAYLLTTNYENVITIPVELVKELRLTGGDAAPPTGLVFAAPQVLAGVEVTPPGRREALAAFGRPPSLFHGSPMSFRWYPTDAFQGQDSTQFSPVTWAKTSIDPIWSPISGYSWSTDVSGFHPVRWYQTSIDPTWHPGDGFGAHEWFAPVVKNRE